MFMAFRNGSNPEEAAQIRIVAVDLQAMAPILGVTQIQGDITKVFWKNDYNLITSTKTGKVM